MELTNKALDKISTDSNLRAKLMLVDGKSESTIARWVNVKSIQFTLPIYTSVIAEHTGLDIKDILTEPTLV
jgi:hypothetical protein